MSDSAAGVEPASTPEDRLKELENMAEGARTVAKQAMQRVNELEQELEERRQRDSRLVDEIAKLEERTELLQALQRATSLKKDERLFVMIQTLYNKAQSNTQSNAATMDYSDWQAAVGGNPDRSLFYGEDGDAQRAVDLVGDEDVLTFKQERRGARKNSRLILNLDAGSLAEVIPNQGVGK